MTETAAGRRAFRIAPGAAIAEDLGDAGTGLSATTATGSNEAGLVVGAQLSADGTHAVLWAPEGMRDLGDLPGGGTDAIAHAVNAAGHVVGRATSTEGTRAFLWRPEEGMVDLNDLTTTEGGLILRDARAIDGAGRIAGIAEDAEGPRGFVWDPETGLVDLGTSEGGLRPVAMTGFGPDGAVVGRARSPEGRERPILWSAGDGIRDLDTLPGGAISGTARAMGDAGEIVGQVVTERGRRAFLWDEVAGMVDLNDLILAYEGVTLREAVDIDANGRILAYGPRDGATHVFVLEPEANALAEAAGIDVADLGMGYDKGLGSGSYTLTDLGAFLTDDGVPTLAMDESGGIVGGCEVTAPACPYLGDLELVTNLFEEDVPFVDWDRPTPPIVTRTGTPPGPNVGGPGRPERTSPPLLPPGGWFPGGGGGTSDGGNGTPGSGGNGGSTPGGSGTPGGGTPTQPSLEIPAIPLPPAGIALFAALSLLGGFGRRRRGT
ncbi:hypothetical protein [Palleronia sp. LCG004]|uniref:hypothetical protein n=1 Tax=Palleronia sp. LCG004 TaxID=3079304 RepID=UPI002942B5AA|nr:hypothetical protein [Palleronia sp. LCG004]WOI58389.1 hypothetical protein RVY76_18580 [Palleronia sp. LCG004]